MKIRLSACLLDLDPATLSEAEKQTVLERNDSLFQAHVIQLVDEKHRTLFLTLNDWKYSSNFDKNSRLIPLMKLAPFSQYTCQLAMQAAKSEDTILNPKNFIFDHDIEDLKGTIVWNWQREIVDHEFWKFIWYDSAFNYFVGKAIRLITPLKNQFSILNDYKLTAIVDSKNLEEFKSTMLVSMGEKRNLKSFGLGFIISVGEKMIFLIG